VNTGLDENEAELSVLILAVAALEMLADGDGLHIVLDYGRRMEFQADKTYLLDEHVQILWDRWCETWIITTSVTRTKRRHNCIKMVERLLFRASPTRASGFSFGFTHTVGS
jgi:hypothetical protein